MITPIRSIEELWFAEDDGPEVVEKASASLAAGLSRVQGLKTFPVVAQRALAQLSNPDFGVSKIAVTIEEDPALAAGVLRMANSPLFAGGKPCASLSQAIMRLGSNIVRQVVLAVATMGMFPDRGGQGKRVRDHSVATAAIARVIALDFCPAHSEAALLGGLLHDVGKLMLLESGETPEALDLSPAQLQEPDAVHEVERAALGYDHAVLGGHVLSAWSFPSPIPEVVTLHHQPYRAYERPELGPAVALVRVADQIEYQLALANEAYEEFLDGLVRRVDGDYLNLSSQALGERWDTFYHVRADAFSMFGG